MRKAVLLTLGVFLWTQAILLAQPDPRDSIIIESKKSAPGAYPGAATDTAAYLYLKVFITNRDSLTSMTLALVERSTSGGAYAILGRPRTFKGVASRLTTTLGGSLVLNAGTGTGNGYNSASPDSFLIAAVYDNLDPANFEPPNAVRKAFWEIKFDSVLNKPGTFELDAGRVVQPSGFTNMVPKDLPVNFVKGVVTVARKEKAKK